MSSAGIILFAGIVATSASALTYYPNTARVRVTSATGSFIQLAEIKVTDPNNVNHALASRGAVASALNQFDGISGAATAIDGNTNGVAASGIYRSAGTSSDYLDVILDRTITLSEIILYGRTDADTAGNLFGIEVFDRFGRSLFVGSVDATLGPKITYFDVIGTPVVPGPFPLIRTPPILSSGAPEPASWALLIAGFGLVGTALRRRPVALTA